MSRRSTEHSTFVIERTYPVPPARVFQAWASREAKARWFACHDDWERSGHTLDFRVGGRETLDSRPPGAEVHRFDALFHDIVPDQRIVFSYDLYIGERRVSVSLTTIELEPVDRGTRLLFTEQGVFLDGLSDPVEREEGTRAGLDNLDAEMRR